MDTSNETSLPLPRPSRFNQLLHWCMLIVFTITSLAPSAHAYAGGPGILSGLAQGTSETGGGNEEEERYRKFFERARAEVAAVAGKPDKYGRLPAADRQEAAREKLDDLIDELDEIQSEIDEEFEDVGKLVRSKKLPKTIRVRHDAAFASITAEFNAVRRDIRQVRSERDPKKRKSLAEGLYRRLDTNRFQRPQQEFDPQQLPNSTLQPDEQNGPRLTEDDYIADGLIGNPIHRVAQAGGYIIANLPGASDPAYLAETDEVVLTDDIRAKAAELGNEPVRIYEWVRNNVQWAPTWGAIQDASHTLSSQRGNAFDIASLTIALLRASDYPARYVHGSIDVPEAAFRNWVGGFQNINAAMEFASSGGVPLGPVTNAGRITKVRMEHIWVEAAIDFHPSRGTRNREADTWVAMDPSFKQLDILPGLDVRQITGIDTGAVFDAMLGTGTLNEAEQWMTGFDPTLLDNTTTQAAAALQAHVLQNMPNATLGDILGGRAIAASTVSSLPAGLPNKVVVTGTRYGRLPASLQQQVTFALGRDVTGEPVNPRTFAWAPLNNRQITLSFRPATPEDEQALRSLLPPGEITDVSQYPSSIPAYLIDVVPELKVDGAVVLSGSAMRLGTPLTFVFNARFAGRGTKPFSYSLPAGSLLAVSVIGGTISPRALDAAFARIGDANAVLTANDPAGLATLSRDQVVGDHFHAGLMQYYDEYTAYGHIMGLRQGGHHNLAAGLGSYGFEPNVSYLFGVPRQVNGGGAVMNVPIVNVVGFDDSARVRSRGYTLQLGLISSALEHEIPERMFSAVVPGAQAISAVKALEKARVAGQRIYVITPASQATVFPLLNLPAATMAEISAALAAGRHVVTHTNVVSVPGWSGAGYIAFDPETGSGAYKISGGQNGAILVLLLLMFAILYFGWVFLAARSLLTFIKLAIVVYEFKHYTHELSHSDTEDVPRATLAALLSVLTALFLPHIYEGPETFVLELIVFFSILGGGCIAGVYEVCRADGDP